MHTFRGYYFRHQNENQTLALIVGKSTDSAFIQVVTEEGSKLYPFATADFTDCIRIGDNQFSKDGVHLALPGLSGDIRYQHLTPLRSDIMGIFRFFPMQCRHTVVSMRHVLNGTVWLDGKPLCFDGGSGYVEGDSGRSFPREYLWIAAHDLPNGDAFFLSVAEIPFCGFRFSGVICVWMLHGKEYRFATYLGAKAQVTDRRVEITQHAFRVEAEILHVGAEHPLAAPQNGRMTAAVRESNCAQVALKLYQHETLIASATSRRAGFERRTGSQVR